MTSNLTAPAVLAMSVSTAVLMVATPDSVPPVAYWLASTAALLTALTVLALGHLAWDRVVGSARDAGVVAP